MPTWVGHLVSAVIGALGTALALYVSLFGKVKDVEARVQSVEGGLKDVRDRVDDRIYRVQEVVAAVLAATEKAIEQNTILIAELRASRKERNG